MFTASDEIESLQPSGIGRAKMRGPGFREPWMFTASDKIEILLRASGREEGRGHARTARALRRMAAGYRPFQPSGGSSRSRKGEL